jgi:class 3 adenylate cyclase/tetratricopeptide (TPR) repeat protein
VAASAITLVFTDVVGSTAAKADANLGSSVSLRDRAYLEAIQSKHLRLVRSAVAEHHGKEIMTIGDSFFLTFDEPLDALRCCAAIQQRLVDQPIDSLHGPLRLRIGIHTGAPEFFEGSWHGHDVDTASRCQSVASPRQIIVSHATRQLLGDPIGIKFRPLGTFALKGVGNVKLWDADYDYHGLRHATVPSNEKKRRALLTTVSIVAAVLLPALVIGAWYLWKNHASEAPVVAAASASAPSPGSVSSIIVANFENKTGEPVFDSLLTPAFTIQLQQSPVLSIVSAEHLRQSMQYLGKSPDAPLTPEDARQIGVREGIKAYLTGTIDKLGNAYVINTTAVNTENGDNIASAEAQAADKDHVLDALSSVATTMRNKLGESLDSIQKLDTPLGQATTPSLEAFRAFALGDAEHDQGHDVPNAEGHYTQALEIDPNFAMAWARLGAVYSNTGQSGKALDCFKKAFGLSKTVSEREQFHIAGFYYGDVTGDQQKAIDTLELACRTYPREKGYYINLAIAQSAVGRLEEALVNAQKALALSPDSAISNVNVLYDLMLLDRFPEALAFAAELQKLGLNDTSDTSNLYSLHAFTGDHAAMAQDLAVVQGRDDEYLINFTVALMHEFFGQYADAEKAWTLAAEQAGQRKARDAQALYLLCRLCGRTMADLPAIDTSGQIKAALALDQTKGTLEAAAIVAATCNQPEIAQPLLTQLAHDYPDDTQINQIWLPISRATLDLRANRPQAALQELQGSEPFDLISGAAYLRGLAYLQLKDGPDAVTAFAKATKYRGAAVASQAQDYGQALLGLARAYLLTGDKDSAKKTYEALFATWKDADADLPQLVAAKKEYAGLL